MPVGRRASRSNDEMWERRQATFEQWCQGVSIPVLAEQQGLDPRTIWDDIQAILGQLKQWDGLEKLSATRQRVIAQLWREVEIASDAEMEARKGVPVRQINKKTGEVDEVDEVDMRAAASYQANRLKALAQIEKLMGLDRAAPSEDDEKKAKTWIDVVRLAREQAGK